MIGIWLQNRFRNIRFFQWSDFKFSQKQQQQQQKVKKTCEIVCFKLVFMMCFNRFMFLNSALIIKTHLRPREFNTQLLWDMDPNPFYFISPFSVIYTFYYKIKILPFCGFISQTAIPVLFRFFFHRRRSDKKR